MGKDNRKFVRYQGKDLPIMPRGSPVHRFYTARWRNFHGVDKLCLVKKESDGSESVLLYDEGLIPAPFGTKKLTIAEARRRFAEESKNPISDQKRKAKKTFKTDFEGRDLSSSDAKDVDDREWSEAEFKEVVKDFSELKK